MKCPGCRGCFDKRIINNNLYLYCFLCQKYYHYDATEKKLIDDTLSLSPKKEEVKVVVKKPIVKK